MHIAREFFLGPPITSQLRQNKQFRGTHSIAHRAFGPIDVWDFFVGLPNVYTNVLGSQKENSIQSYRRTVVPHTLSLILLVYISHFSADTLTHKMSFVFFLAAAFSVVCWTEHQILISRRTLAHRRQISGKYIAQPTNLSTFRSFTIVCRKSHVECDGWCVLYCISVVSLKIYNFDKQNENSCDMNNVKLATSLTLLFHIYLQCSAIWRP